MSMRFLPLILALMSVCGGTAAWAKGDAMAKPRLLRGAPTELKEELFAYWDRCTAGEGEACVQLATAYEEGRGLKTNQPFAAALLQRACEMKHIRGCSRLGLRLYKGVNGTKDLPGAAKYLEMACEADQEMACLNFGNLLVKGEGLEADPGRAADIFDTWCSRGHHRSCVRLGHLLREGKGTEAAPEKAHQSYVQACDGNDYEGCYWAGYMAATGKSGSLDYVGAQDWLDKACVDGHLGYACYFGGMLNEKGMGPGTSRRRALQLYRKGCEFKDAKSCEKAAAR